MKKLIIILLTLNFIACDKTEENEPFAPVSPTPEIELVNVSALKINQFDDLVFQIRYTDGDGDIGTQDADAHSLEIIDKRDDIVHSFHIPPQYVVKGLAITGILEVSIENVILLDQANDSEEAIFSIKLRDNKFNWSESVNSPVITIEK